MEETENQTPAAEHPHAQHRLFLIVLISVMVIIALVLYMLMVRQEADTAPISVDISPTQVETILENDAEDISRIDLDQDIETELAPIEEQINEL